MSYVPPPAPPASQVHAPVPTYLAWAITVTVLSFLSCCVSCLSFPGLVTGIVAIVFAVQGQDPAQRRRPGRRAPCLGHRQDLVLGHHRHPHPRGAGLAGLVHLRRPGGLHGDGRGAPAPDGAGAV